MTTNVLQNSIEIQAPENGNLSIKFAGSGGQLIVNGKIYSVNKDGLLTSQNDLEPTANLVDLVLEVGQRLKDGTIIISIDPDKNETLRVPTDIFGGQERSMNQDNVVEAANQKTLHGHTDWRRLKSDEVEILSKAWEKVAPAELQGSSAPWFWASPPQDYRGKVRRGGDEAYSYFSRSDYRYRRFPVPIVRIGSANVPAHELV